ncbi:GSCFA domain-containing protein [Maliponia aquimaris]|uniref:GSCFA family protein n=1 Tax=Maliponia aquimaris TaxID=1673631 RepID=A0A238KG51_9RHOB|nr:GSCFA domain-containing protein [Maliponia aquimaris]SMX40996.1 GSCFA family protein [Maliponia aquimaris]
MPNPYQSLSHTHFWKTAVSDRRDRVHPQVQKSFRIAPGQRVATAGSCFAQNLARHLRDSPAVSFMEAEPLRPDDPVFSGRYGNIYTAHQLLQLFEEVESGAVDKGCAIRRHDGRWVDMHRPFIEPDGFADPDAVFAARAAHCAAIRPVFHEADVLVFTLGLTEAWQHTAPGRVLPACPGIYSDAPATDYEFVNFGFAEVKAAMEQFAARLTAANPAVKLLLTVSPVPLTATYTQDHVLVATMHSKAILRAVSSELAAEIANIFYFPSYEMVANPYTDTSAFSPDNLREVTPEAVQEVMRVFDADYLDVATAATARAHGSRLRPEEDDLFCDDVEIEKSIGF